ncbi:MAG: endonuclease domain-containing protein, partial [Chitinophagaceae bacterium]
RLRNRQANGLKFRRQHPLDKFVADFYCHEKRLVIELDGGMHESKMQKEKDRVRTEILDKLAITVVRFKNEEVLKDNIGVTKEIIRIAGSLPFANKR